MQTQLINFTIPKPLLRLVDDQAKQELKTRSELLRDAVRSYLENRLILKKRWQDLVAYVNKQAGALNIKPQNVENLIDDYRSAQ